MTAYQSIELESDEADFVERLVRDGTYSSREDVIRAGLRALRASAVDLDDWLQTEVVPVSAAMVADPERALTAELVFDGLHTLHRNRSTRVP